MDKNFRQGFEKEASIKKLIEKIRKKVTGKMFPKSKPMKDLSKEWEKLRKKELNKTASTRISRHIAAQLGSTPKKLSIRNTFGFKHVKKPKMDLIARDIKRQSQGTSQKILKDTKFRTHQTPVSPALKTKGVKYLKYTNR